MNLRHFHLGMAIALLSGTLAQAKDYGSELISGCAAIQIGSCKMTSRTVKLDLLSKYEKAFSCIKNGSTSGDKFNLGIPLPDLGELGFGGSSSHKYSTEVCKEEIKKLDSANFLKDYSETFDKECGRTLAGQYQQCIEAAGKLSGPQQIQSLKCSASQSASNIIINTKYVPGMGDGPTQYRIASVTGIEGLSCDGNASAGVNQYASMSCKLPQGYSSAQLVVKLGNGVSCTVPVKMERRLEVDLARKYTCSNIYNSLPQDEFPLPLLIKATAVGLCDLCLADNTRTPDSDQRTLANRAAGCATWAIHSIATANAALCSVKDSNAGPGFSGGFYAPPAGFGGPMAAMPPILPTAPGTERDVNFSMGLSSDNPQNAQIWAQSLCNGRKKGEVMELRGDQWKQIPIDYLSSSAAQDPRMQELAKRIEDSLKGN
jgi:hypothetical protein